MNALTSSRVEQRHPILHRLQREADKNQAYSEDPHGLLRRMIRKPYDERRAGTDYRGG